MKRNILRLFISIILIGLICIQSIYAEGMTTIGSMTTINMGQSITTITVGDAETIEGNEITVPISISNNFGLIGLTLSVEYDSNILTLTSIARGEALSSLVLTKPGDLTLNPFKLLWDGVDADASNGSIALLEFTIVDNTASVEDVIDVTVVAACDDDMEDVEIVVNKSLLISNSQMENINCNEPASTNSNTTPQTDETSDLTITSNIKLNGITVGENGMRIIDDANLSCTFNISNASSDDKIVAILATYKSNGELHGLQLHEISATQTHSQDIEPQGIDYTFDVKKDHLGKLIFWNLQKNLMPIRASIEFTQNSGINIYCYDEDMIM